MLWPGAEMILQSDADVVIIDWEASVIASRKEAARQNTISFLKQADGRNIAIRLNPYSGCDFLDDEAALSAFHKSIADGFPDDGQFSRRDWQFGKGAPAVIASRRHDRDGAGAHTGRRYCGVPSFLSDSVWQHGLPDRLAVAPPGRERWLDLPQFEVDHCVSRCGSAGLNRRCYGEHRGSGSLRCLSAIRKEPRFSRELCAHPSQLAPARQVFAPYEREIAWAKQVLEATRHSHAVMIDGRMIDRPVIDRARKILGRVQTWTK